MSNLGIIFIAHVHVLYLKRRGFEKVAALLKKIARLLPLATLAAFTSFCIQYRLTEISISPLKITVTK